ncbi:MAG: hypothetical protein LBG20_02930 [Holosporaceae bacterium]|jgi:type VI secretion system protein ImpL|nr:hypothetical protein [Holosporaceae bacterium]
MDIKGLLSSKISLVPKELVPAISIGVIIVAFLLILVFFVLCIAYINMKPKPVVKRDDKKAHKKDEKLSVKMRHEDLPIISGRMGEILTMMGFLHAGPITRVFFKVLEVIKNSTYDIRWRYKLPCFMMAGLSGSGKSTLLDGLNFEHLTDDGSALDSMWKLFKDGIIFEMPQMDSSENIDKFWSFISELFIFIRPRRPLDGILVTLPADMLLLETFDAEKHAQEMFERVFKFQHEVNFHLPMYLIITKMDYVPGFLELVNILNDTTRQQIFGWSCPYSLRVTFSSDWIREIFETVEKGIERATFYFLRDRNEDFERAVLLEYNLRKIKTPLRKYLQAMFQTYTPEDGLLLRGVYFVGQQNHQMANISEDILSPSALTPGVNLAFRGSYNNEMCFTQDLFSEKIFREHNIAYPIHLNSIDMNKIEQRNKIIMALGSSFVAFGWFWGNANIKQKIHEYYSVMASVKTTMVKIKYLETHLKGEEDQAFINKQTTAVLKNMPLVKRFDFISVFVPQSWFANLHKEMLETIGLVFDSVIIRAMYIDINLNAKHILQNTLDDSRSMEKKNNIFDVNSFPSFKKLHEFVKQINRIEKISAEYDSIRHLEDRKSVADLTMVLFKENFDIAEDVKDRVPSKRLIPPRFDITLFKTRIESNLKLILTAFLNDVLDVTVERILQNLSRDIDGLIEISQNSMLPYSSENLAKVYNKTLLISDIWKSKNFFWIALDHFAPCQEYIEIMKKLGASSIVSKDYLKELIKLSELEFHKFRAKLFNYSTDLTGKLLTPDFKNVSTGFINFQKEIQTLLDQPFISIVPKDRLNTVILEDKMLIWELQKLKELSNLIDKYYAFIENMPPDIRPRYFEMYKIIARKCFYPMIEATLGSAQVFEDIPLGHSNDLLAEAYKRQANNIRGASVALTKVAKVLEEMQEEDNTKTSDFVPMIVDHYSTLLERIDALFSQSTPYAAGHAVFDSWDGNQTPRYLDISGPDDLREYFVSQFGQIRFLAKDLAAPIVDLLSMPYFAEKIRDHRLLAKWREIISSVDDYEKKKPGNSIAALEGFLSNNLSKISLGSFDEKGEIKNLSETGGDYFLSRRSEVAKSLLSRAEVVRYEKAATAYERLRQFFNDNLAHKFPFGKSDQDASLKNMENFMNLYEKNAKDMKEVLSRNQDIKNIGKQALEFLDSMNDKVIPFLKIWINHSKAPDAKSALIAFNVKMRPSPELEAMTSSVVDREMFMDNAPVEDNENCIFFNGNKVNVIFSYVPSSDERPNAREANGNLKIEESKATFSYEGRWAIFRMIEEHKTNRETELPNGVLLQFNVPIYDTSRRNVAMTSKMVLKITPMAKDEDKVTPIAWPIFPELWPSLHGTEKEKSAAHEAPHKLDVNVSFDELPAKAEGITPQ